MVADAFSAAWKYIRGVLLAAAGVYALSAVQNLYSLDHVPTQDEALALLWKSAKGMPALVQDWLVSRPYDAVIDHPILSAVILILVVVAVVLGFLLTRAHSILNLQSTILSGADANYALVTQAGIEGRFPHARQSEDGAPWKSLCEEILSPENKFVYILGANGIDTFGRPGAPLYEALQNFRGNIRVILCKPGSKQMKGRAAAVGVNSNDYEKAIRDSVKRLRTLRNQAYSVEGRYYEGQPNWKLIITNSTVWVQYYLPGGPHVDQTPVWLVSVTPNADGFYHLFHLEFNRIWERCASNPITLNSSTGTKNGSAAAKVRKPA
ncbi:hypothetical protein XH83_33740 [Bradyrhizobium sp. CCBAU 53351]|nr:hypothetical protein XH83_33740 [Bradyrhizobium sp. CCBAU 53351]